MFKFTGNLADILFNNMIPILVFLFIVYIILQLKKLGEYKKEIQKRFDQVLTEYLNKKINEAKEVTDSILKEYGREDAVSTEISRLLATIEKGQSGDINDKVNTSNAINKFRLSKDIDLERYPSLAKLKELGTFNETDMTSLDNGVALARKEYNTYAFRYNQIASGFPVQYVTKLVGLKSHYNIFGNPKGSNQEVVYETLDSGVEEDSSLSTLNFTTAKREEQKKEEIEKLDLPEEKEVQIEHSDIVLKPTQDLHTLSDMNNKNS